MTTAGFGDWWRLLAPQGLKGRPAGLGLGAVCLLTLAVIFLVEKLTPAAVVVGTLSFIPVFLAVWLLSAWLAAAVTVAAVALRIAAVIFAGIHPLTVVAEVITIVAIATLGRFLAVVVSAYWAAQAQTEERERIARELHDGTIQSLFAVGIGLRAQQSTGSSGRIQEAVAELDRVITDLRNYVYGLRPLILADRLLDEALAQLMREFEANTRVTGVLHIDPSVAAELGGKAPDVVQLAREALSNVGRHANAQSCRLTLRRDNSAAVLEVEDDGRGFLPAAANGTGQGLNNMRVRAAALGGGTEIEAAPQGGTRVRITIPLGKLERI